MTEILVLEKPEEKLRRERERLLGELSVYGERLAVLQDTIDEIKEMIKCYDEAIENQGTDHAKQNSKTIKEAFDDMGEAFGGVETKIAGEYLSGTYLVHENLLKRLLHDDYRYLARDENGTLYAYDGSPVKAEETGYWDIYLVFDSEPIQNDSFPEVKWYDEEPTKIADLLDIYRNGGEDGK